MVSQGATGEESAAVGTEADSRGPAIGNVATREFLHSFTPVGGA